MAGSRFCYSSKNTKCHNAVVLLAWLSFAIAILPSIIILLCEHIEVSGAEDPATSGKCGNLSYQVFKILCPATLITGTVFTLGFFTASCHMHKTNPAYLP